MKTNTLEFIHVGSLSLFIVSIIYTLVFAGMGYGRAVCIGGGVMGMSAISYGLTIFPLSDKYHEKPLSAKQSLAERLLMGERNEE